MAAKMEKNLMPSHCHWPLPSDSCGLLHRPRFRLNVMPVEIHCKRCWLPPCQRQEMSPRSMFVSVTQQVVGLVCLSNTIEVTFFSFSPLKKHLSYVRWPQTADRNKKKLEVKGQFLCLLPLFFFVYWYVGNIACIKYFELLLWNWKLSEREERMKCQINEMDGRKSYG